MINYYRPGWYNINYTVSDNFGCKSFTTTAVQWYPAPNVVIFEPTVREGCVPLTVNFKNISFLKQTIRTNLFGSFLIVQFLQDLM